MSRLWKIVKLSTRFGIVGGAVYITTQEGLWASPEETILFYQKVKEMLPGSEVVVSKDYQQQIAVAVEKAKVWSNPEHKPLAERWNAAVLKSFKFLDSAPNYFSSEIQTIQEKAKKYIN